MSIVEVLDIAQVVGHVEVVSQVVVEVADEPVDEVVVDKVVDKVLRTWKQSEYTACHPGPQRCGRRRARSAVQDLLSNSQWNGMSRLEDVILEGVFVAVFVVLGVFVSFL